MFRHISILLFLIVTSFTVTAQYEFNERKLPVAQSILSHAKIADAGHRDFSVNEIRNGRTNLKFAPLTGDFGNLGFTDHTFWLKFELKNNLKTSLFYYLLTAEPITDQVNLYQFNRQGQYTLQKSGDKLHFDDRSVANRKTIFKLELKPGEVAEAFLEVKNDGEKNSLPLVLISQQKMLQLTYQDQLIMGIFYGILAVISITYFFFYFALRERSFLYYSLYVTFVGLCQFALDGFFHQYFDQSDSWINLHAVIITAIFSAYLFGKYSEIILGIKQNYRRLHFSFKGLYILLGLVLVGVFLFPSFLKFSYPLINILTIAGMVLIFISIAALLKDKQPIDIYFVSGIFILFLCIVIAVLFNFGLLPAHISTDNITKPGIGLEIIALSLSMANRIRLLKSKQEEAQTIALQKSEEMNDIKSYFLSNMSHELRTPLNAILGLASLMETENDTEKIKQKCELIKFASHGLISSVNDIIDFSKIEKGELKLADEQFKIAEVIEKIKIGTQTQADSKNLSFVFECNLVSEITVIGDPVRLAQILYNLLSNALKFTLSGTVTLKVFCEVKNDQLLLNVKIADTGVGIPKQKLSAVFDMFSQTELHTKRKFDGFGIGLSIVKALVDLQKGKITLASTLGQGTICEVSLSYPVSKQVAITENIPEKPFDLTSTHVLVVEDNQINQMVIKMILKKWGTKVTLANDGAEGLAMLKAHAIDIVLMDLQMPIMDGYEAIAAIRKGDAGLQNSTIPIIVITADVNESSKERIFSLGADDYMTKPIDQNILNTKIIEHCS